MVGNDDPMEAVMSGSDDQWKRCSDGAGTGKEIAKIPLYWNENDKRPNKPGRSFSGAA